ncbi:glycoside hydrolase family 32 protein [Lactiplantibacillus daowaiensis]|uniref:Sucrose-6-phosphate hydrolase n=1 Tax=Lactiplantibacillus daowaiensis TaxID=2559918 RepID=A0ABW1RXT8_9LACO|nr:sucrose-6-phosphate hydrolase [Lactiplantibacillus daowaiensis]
MTTQSKMTVTNQRYRLGYHLMTPGGWMNDPNGFCYFQGYYHVFYQYYPYAAEWGPMHWGHARSKDLVNWETLPTALTPGDPEDEDGCFSGSAIVKDDKLILIYTGHHYYGDNDPDHFWQNQNMAYSTDGIHFTKYAHNPIIAQAPTDNTQHFRDPKVWQDNDHYYLVLGSQNQTGNGRVILYQADNLTDWTYLGPIAEAGDAAKEGFMWECPDLFELNGQQVLLTSPQGIQATDKQYLNLYQTGYFVGQRDAQQPGLMARTAFQELDHGHDFYATQTTLTPDGRRVMLGWMAMWESQMPEQADGWAGALTCPRELTMDVDNHLRMRPVREMATLRTQTLIDQTQSVAGSIDLQPAATQAEFKATFDLANLTGQLTVSLLNTAQQAVVTLTFDQTTGELVLKRADRPDARYAQLAPNQTTLTLDGWLDTSSLEWFINDGQAVFTERFYDAGTHTFQVAASQPVTMQAKLYALTAQTNHY